MAGCGQLWHAYTFTGERQCEEKKSAIFFALRLQQLCAIITTNNNSKLVDVVIISI